MKHLKNIYFAKGPCKLILKSFKNENRLVKEVRETELIKELFEKQVEQRRIEFYFQSFKKKCKIN